MASDSFQARCDHCESRETPKTWTPERSNSGSCHAGAAAPAIRSATSRRGRREQHRPVLEQLLELCFLPGVEPEHRPNLLGQAKHRARVAASCCEREIAWRQLDDERAQAEPVLPAGRAPRRPRRSSGRGRPPDAHIAGDRAARPPGAHDRLRLVEPDRHVGPQSQDQLPRNSRLALRERGEITVQVDPARVRRRSGVARPGSGPRDPEIGAERDELHEQVRHLASPHTRSRGCSRRPGRVARRRDVQT